MGNHTSSSLDQLQQYAGKRLHAKEDVKQTAVVPKCKADQPTLNQEQIQNVLNTWAILRGQIQDIGVITFLKLFDTHPETKNKFPMFRELSHDDLRQSDVLKNHAFRVMNVIEKVINRINTPESYRSYLHILGQKHAAYEAEPKYMDSMALMFLGAIEPILKEKECWNEDVRAAWEQVFVVIIYEMKSAMEDQSNSDGTPS